MTESEKYANQWDKSAQYFYQSQSYFWMSKHIEKYHNVLEVGCGTGYSTLDLAQEGHFIRAIDKNNDCLNKAEELINNHNLANNVQFINGDVADEAFRTKITEEFDFDIVICWNVGSYWDKEMLQFYVTHMRKYGLTDTQIIQNPESSYAELILWDACDIASRKKVPIQIIERIGQEFNQNLRDYYGALAGEFGYTKAECNIKEGSSLSQGGRILTMSGNPNMDKVVKINFLSVIFE